MGEVWRGHSVPTGLPVAIKVVRPEVVTQVSRGLFEREMHTLASLDHQNIVEVLDIGKVPSEASMWGEGSAWLAMEYLSGGSLQALRIDDWRVLVRVLRETLHALAHAHARGIVHRDLKPANLVIGMPGDSRPGLKLCDFGIAAIAGEKAQSAGTLPFMAPEQFGTDGQGPWTDLYALGVLGWYLACRSLPFAGDLNEIRTAKGTGLPSLVSGLPVSASFQGWLRWLAEPSPARRPSSCQEALRALVAMAEPDSSMENSDASAPLDTLLTWQTLPDTEEPPLVLSPALEGEGRTSTGSRELEADWRGRAHRSPPARLRGAGLGLITLRDPVLVGRESERDRLWAWARGEGPRSLALVGPPAVGKSALGHWLIRAIREGGGVGVEITSAEPRAALWQLFIGLCSSEPDLIAPAQSSTTEGLRSSAKAALEGCIARGPVTIHLDCSSQVGRSVESICDSAAVRLLWTDEAPATAETIDLLPLPPEVVAEITRRHAGLDPAVAVRLAEDSQGLPGIALDRLVGAVLAGAYTWESTGLKLHSQHARSFDGLPPELTSEQLEALQVGAVIGRGVPAVLWEPLVQTERGWGGVQVLVRRHLAVYTRDGWAFTDPTVRREILARFTPGEMSDLRRQVLALIDAETELPERELWRARQQTALGDLTGAFHDWRGAIWACTHSRGCHAAIALTEELQECLDDLGIAPDDPRRGAVMALRSQLWRAGGEREESSKEVGLLLNNAAIELWPAAAGAALLQRSRNQVYADRDGAWRDLCASEAHIARVDPAGIEVALTGVDIVELGLWIQYDKARLLGVFGKESERLEVLGSIPDDARDAGCYEIEADACADLAFSLLGTDPTRAEVWAARSLERNQELGRLTGVADALSVRGHVGLATGRYEAALDAFEAGAKIHSGIQNIYEVFPLLGATRALLHLDRVDEAAEFVRDAVHKAPGLGAPTLAYALVLAAAVDALRGDMESAIVGVERAREAGLARIDDIRELLTELDGRFGPRLGPPFWSAAGDLAADD